jgi:hypothetical protein
MFSYLSMRIIRRENLSPPMIISLLLASSLFFGILQSTIIISQANEPEIREFAYRAIIPILFTVCFLVVKISNIEFSRRRREVVILLTRGFSGRSVVRYLIYECILVGLFSGLIGVAMRVRSMLNSMLTHPSSSGYLSGRTFNLGDSLADAEPKRVERGENICEGKHSAESSEKSKTHHATIVIRSHPWTRK